MIVFKKIDEDKFLITNYKVMYSTLSSQPNLIRFNGKKLVIQSLKSWSFPSRPRFYLLVRNPYRRIESFFKDKFQKAEEYRLWMIKNNMDKQWQMSTEIFFPYLGLTTSMDPEEISTRLSQVTFDEFISILPEVLMKDRHLTPQYLARILKWKFFGIQFNIPIRIEAIFKLESPEELKLCGQLFEIDVSIKKNSTNHIKEEIYWEEHTVSAINHHYRRDFRDFQYKRK